MPKPRKPIRLTYNPPVRPGWYAYRHCDEEIEAVYLNQESLEDAQNRFKLALAVEITPADVWSTRKLKKREHTPRRRKSVQR